MLEFSSFLLSDSLMLMLYFIACTLLYSMHFNDIAVFQEGKHFFFFFTISVCSRFWNVVFWFFKLYGNISTFLCLSCWLCECDRWQCILHLKTIIGMGIILLLSLFYPLASCKDFFYMTTTVILKDNSNINQDMYVLLLPNRGPNEIME